MSSSACVSSSFARGWSRRLRAAAVAAIAVLIVPRSRRLRACMWSLPVGGLAAVIVTLGEAALAVIGLNVVVLAAGVGVCTRSGPREIRFL
eukprot:2047530-Prymnesium_polylepis.1